MTTAAEEVKKAGTKLLGRDFGPTGKGYWEAAWQRNYDNALAANPGDAAAAAAAATAGIERDIGLNTEAKVYAAHGVARKDYEGATKADGSTYDMDDIDKTADWFTTRTYTADDDNEYARGTRDVDWASKLNTGNLAGYLKNQNYQYGTLQGNTVGQEGNEWFGYEKTGAIDHYMSPEGGNYSFQDASDIADAKIAKDIAAHETHKNFIRYGSVGYGGQLDIKTAQEANVDTISSDPGSNITSTYLNFDPDAMAALKAGGLYAGTGFTSGVDDDGSLVTTGSQKFAPYYIDDDGNFVSNIPDDYTGDLITDTAASQFTYVEDPSAPGGYRITANPDLKLSQIVAGEASETGDQGTVVSGYIGARGNKTFEIPSGVGNVDASRFTLADNDPNKLTLSQWVENPGNYTVNDAGEIDYSYKNQGFNVVNGELVWQPGTLQGGTATGLGLKQGENLIVKQGDGREVKLIGGEVVTTTNNTSNTSNTTNNEYIKNFYGGGGGGGKTIIATPPPPSKTAKMQQIKEPTKLVTQAPKRDQYNKIRTKGPTTIPGAGGGLSIPVG